MSDQSQGPGWWLASDGKWYPPESAPAPPPPGQYAAPIQPQYPQPIQPGYVRPTTNGLAIASMVLGILWLYFIGSILALVFGYIARKQIDESQGTQSGRGMATAGIVLGWIGVVLLVGSLVIVVLASLGDSASSSFSSTGSAIN